MNRPTRGEETKKSSAQMRDYKLKYDHLHLLDGQKAKSNKINHCLKSGSKYVQPLWRAIWQGLIKLVSYCPGLLLMQIPQGSQSVPHDAEKHSRTAVQFTRARAHTHTEVLLYLIASNARCHFVSFFQMLFVTNKIDFITPTLKKPLYMPTRSHTCPTHSNKVCNDKKL